MAQNFASPALAPDLLARQLRMQQDAQYGQRMLDEGSQMPQGQMVSGHFVAPSWSQYLAQGLKSYLGRDTMNRLPDQMAGMQQAQQDYDRQRFNSVFGGGQAPGTNQQDTQREFMIAQLMGLDKYAEQRMKQGAPTAVQQNLIAAGLQPGSQEFQSALLENVNPSQRPTTLMQNVSAAGLQPGTPEYQNAILAGTKQGTTVNVNSGDKAWDTESAKLFAKRYDDISAGAMNAQQMLGMYDLAEQALSSGVRTGVGGEAELSLRQLGAAMGMDTDPEKVAGGELVRAVQNRMALTMRSPDGGMGMPGALSDRDIKFLKDSQIGIDRSPEGNRKMLAAFRSMENRKIEIARLADEYIEQKGKLDSGFNRVVREYANANPLFQASTANERMQQLDDLLGF